MRSLKSWMKLVCVLVIFMLALSGCGQAAVTTTAATTAKPAATTAASAATTAATTAKPVEAIKIALVAPMTGDSAQYGQQFKRGIELFLADYNKKGAFNGAKVDLTVFDDKNDAKEAVNIANKIVSDGKFFCVIGPFSSTCGLAMAEVLDEEKILTISPSVSHADYVTKFDYTFRLSHVNSAEGIFVAKYCGQVWGTKKMAAIYTNNDWGLSLDDAFKAEVTKQGMSLVANEPFIIGQTKDFSPILTKIKQNGADTVYLICQYTEAGQIMRQIKDMGINIKVFVSSSAYKTESLDLAGDGAVGAKWVTSFIFDNPNPKLQEFRAKVKAQYNVEIDNMIVRAYDAASMALGAMDSAKKFDSQSIKDEIMKTKNYDSLSGKFTLEADRNITRLFYIAGPTKDLKTFIFLEEPTLK